MAKSVSAFLQRLTAKIKRSRENLTSRLGRVLTDRNNYLLILFIAYLILIPAFAVIYTLLYQGDRQRFAFNQDIARAQQQIVKASTQYEIEHGKRLVGQLHYLSTYLAESKTQVQFPKWYEGYKLKVYGDQYHYECTVKVMVGGAPGSPQRAIPILIIRKTDGQDIETLNLPNGLECPATLDEANLFSTKLVNKFEQDLAQNQSRLESLDEEFPEIWSYVDFVYFSTVTQTTVGYGDIVPNSTSVRVVVIVQLLLGTALLVVGLNLVLKGKNEKRNGHCQGTGGSAV